MKLDLKDSFKLGFKATLGVMAAQALVTLIFIAGLAVTVLLVGYFLSK